MGNIVCKKTSTIVPSGGMCGKCPMCLGRPGFGHCAYWRKDSEVIKCTPEPEPVRCETCSRCNMFQGYGVQCKYWSLRDGNIKKADAYADSVGINDANKKVLHVHVTEGQPAAFKAMFTGEQGQELSYSEMRARYG